MKYERLLLDIETQRDFLVPSGNCWTAASAAVAKQVARLFDWVQQESIPVLSTVLRVRPNEQGPLCNRPHCVEDTDGEAKWAKTILPSRIDLGIQNTTDLPSDLFDRYQQAIFEKRKTDIFRHARCERLITELPATTFVLCGVGVAHGLVEAAVGLRSRGFSVILAADAVLDLDHPQADMAMRRMEAKGVVFARTSDIVSPGTVVPTGQFKTVETPKNSASKRTRRSRKTVH